MSNLQLPLKIQLSDEARFDNFWLSNDSANEQILRILKDFSGGESEESFVYLWGKSGSGLSHLLQAACQQASVQNRSCLFLPLKDLKQQLGSMSPSDLFESLETMDLVCIDDVDCVFRDTEWEEALFHLYNRMRDRKARLIVSAHCSPQDLSGKLPDLNSRMAWGITYRLTPLTDEQKCLALQYRANLRGLELSNDVAQYLLTRMSREPGDLFALLEQMDRLSLVEKRRLTIPLIRGLLSDSC